MTKRWLMAILKMRENGEASTEIRAWSRAFYLPELPSQTAIG